MRKTGFAIAVVLALVSSPGAHAQGTQTPPTVNYTTFMEQDHEGRLRAFNRITPENRAALVREHIQRWMEVNRSGLTPGQRSVLEDWLEFATPEVYHFPITDPSTLAKRDELSARATALFSTAQLRQVLVINTANYIPPQP
jgi:hypothetical protein